MKLVEGIDDEFFIINILRGKVTGDNGREKDPDNYLLRRNSTSDDGFNLSLTLGKHNDAR